MNEVFIALSIFGGFIAFLLCCWIMSLRVIVPTDKVHIVQRNKSTTSYGAGLDAGNVYYNFPSWMPILGITMRELPVSNFDLDLKNYEAYDQDRVPFIVDVKAFFRIEDTNVAASKVESFNELTNHLVGIVQGAIRSILAKAELSAIMEERTVYGEKFTNSVKNSLKEWGVINVKSIELMDIKDAPGNSSIQNIMAKKQSEIEKDSRITVAKNKQLAREQEIESEQVVNIKQAKQKEAVGIANAQAEQKVGIEKERALQNIKEAAKVTAEKEMAVLAVNTQRQAEITKEAEIVKYEQEKQRMMIAAEAKKEAATKEAEAIKISKDAEAYSIQVTKEAEAKGIENVGKAKADAEKEMQLATVTAQVTLADKIGSNENYQKYLISVKEVEAKRDIGIEQARNLGNADIKIISNAGNVSEGLNNISDIFTPKGGTNLAGMLEGLAQSEIGKKVIDKITKTKKD